MSWRGQVAAQALDSGKIAEKLFPAAKAPNSSGKEPGFGLRNIKSFGFAGPLGLQMGVSRDPDATEPDVTAEMHFTGMDWRVTKLRPDLINRY